MVDARAQALIFDLDGTLVDSMEAHYVAWREACAEARIHLDRERFRRLGGSSSTQIARELLVDDETGDESAPTFLERVATLVAAKDAAYVRHVSVVSPIPAVAEIAERAFGTMPLAVATNESLGVANIVLRSTGLGALFQTLVTIDEVDEAKPAPDVYLECARRLGVDPSHCQVFEDSEPGFEAARAAGMIVTDVRPVR